MPALPAFKSFNSIWLTSRSMLWLEPAVASGVTDFAVLEEESGKICGRDKYQRWIQQSRRHGLDEVACTAKRRAASNNQELISHRLQGLRAGLGLSNGQLPAKSAEERRPAA